MNTTMEDIKNAFSATARKAAVITTELYERSKLAIAISSANGAIDELYKQIGKIVYDAKNNDSFSSDDLTALCDAVDAKREEVAELEKRMAEIKNLETCPQCGATIIGNDNEFCPKCGYKLK